MGELKDIKLGIMHRAVTVDMDELAKREAGDDSIPLAISSESPVDRWFGREILSHDKEHVDLTYARDGLPLLMDHVTTVQIGIVRGLKVSNGVLRGRAYFGNHPDATWVRKDMLDGIRPNVSVGYRVNSMKLTASDQERGDEYTVDSWTPMEVSTVPIPADITVGVGRGADDGALPVQVRVAINPAEPEGEGNMSEVTTTGAEPVKVAARSTEDIRTEIANIYALGAEHGCMDLAAKAVERGISRDRFAAEILERKIAEAKATPTVGVDMSEREHKQYSVAKAILGATTGDWRDAGLEFEASETLRKMSASNNGGVFIPFNVRASVTGNFVSTSSLGGAGVATEMLSLIDLLRNDIVCVQAGAQFLPGLAGNISFPRQITANTLNWVGENPSSANTPGAATLDNVNMSPKSGMVSTAYSRQLLAQSSFDAASFVTSDLSAVVARGIDYAALNGVGSSSQPTGLRVQSGIGNKTLGAAGAALAWADVVSLETTVAVANAANIGSISWLVTPGIRGKLKTTLQNTTSGAAYIYGPDDRINGYRAFVTNQLPTNLTKGTSTTICHAAIFGVMSELMIGQWGPGLEIITDPYSVAGQNMIAVHAFIMADVGIKHPAAFVKCDEILVS